MVRPATVISQVVVVPQQVGVQSERKAVTSPATRSCVGVGPAHLGKAAKVQAGVGGRSTEVLHVNRARACGSRALVAERESPAEAHLISEPSAESLLQLARKKLIARSRLESGRLPSFRVSGSEVCTVTARPVLAPSHGGLLVATPAIVHSEISRNDQQGHECEL